MMETESTLSEPLLLPVSDDNDNDDENHRNSSFGEHDEEFVAVSSPPTSSPIPSSSMSEYSTEIIQYAKRNIRRTLALTFFTFTSRSVWSQSLLSIYVILVWKDHPEYVGYVLATMGMIQMLSSALIRCVTRRFDISSYNKCRRFLLLILASLIGVSAMTLSLYAITMERSRFDLFLLANGLWGMSWGVSESILPIVFAEAVAVNTSNNNNKTTDSTYKMCSILVRLGIIVGSLLTLIVFERLGNQWNIENCVTVMLIGMGCNLPVVFLLCSLKTIPFDDAEVEESVEEDEEQQQYYDAFSIAYESALLLSDEEIMDENYIVEGSLEDRLFIPEEDGEGVDNNYHVLGESDDSSDSPVNEETETEDRKSCQSICCSNRIRVPILIHLADILSSFAGGMSIWYFPVFLFQRLQLEPVTIQFLYLIIPLGQWLSPYLAKLLSRVIGPCRACISMQGTYILFMISMITCHMKGYPIWIICTLYVLHGSLMNSTSTLSRSMILQYVPTEDQHKWGNIAESIQMLLWSCAGVTGGIIVGKMGLLVVFFVTVALQFLATLPLAILYCLLDPRLDDAGKHSISSNIVVGDHDASNNNEDIDGIDTPSRSTYDKKKKRPNVDGDNTTMIGTPETQTTCLSNSSISLDDIESNTSSYSNVSIRVS
ncbi:MAG: MFS family permease [Bacillariaceae sp.]|jgi:MFS family permease